MPLRILVVDDNAPVAKAIIRTLERSFPGAYFACAGNGSEALSFFDADAPFDVVISDFMMPGMTGAELLHKVADRKNDVGLVLCSGGSTTHTDKQMRAKCPLHTSFVPKPFTTEELTSAVRVAMSAVLSV